MMNEESEHKINKYQQHLFFSPAFLAGWCHPRSHICALGELLPELSALKSFLSEEQHL